MVQLTLSLAVTGGTLAYLLWPPPRPPEAAGEERKPAEYFESDSPGGESRRVPRQPEPVE